MNRGDKLPPINFKALADALLAMADTLVPMWLPGGAKVPGTAEYACGSLAGGKGGSCSVNLKKGVWKDFATDETGPDLISLYAAIHGLSDQMGKAAVQVARDYGLEDVAGVQRDPAHQGKPPPPPAPPAAKKRHVEDEGWRTMMPVPDLAPPATFKHPYRALTDIEHTAAYRKDGHLLGYVVRFRTSDGGKDTLPYTWCTSARDGASRWHWKQWDEPRPLYFPGGVSPGGLYEASHPPRTVVLVEGEKKADALQALLDEGSPGVYLVASWPGGCKAWKKALWDWLAGCTVLLWPDCDAKRVPLTKKERDACLDDTARETAQAMKPLLPEHKQPGMAAMLGIGAMLRDTQVCKVQLLPIPKPGDVADGWDCGDAINADGWDHARVLTLFGQAQPLPDVEQEPDPKAAAGGGGGGKKIDGPVGTEGADDADSDDLVPCGNRKVPRWLSFYWDAEKSRWLTSRKLVITALERDPALNQVLGLNELSCNIEARLDWPWPHGQAGPIKGSTDLMLGLYLSQTYGLPSIPRAALLEAIETVAHTRPFHPVREYLHRLSWDNKPRLDKWLVHVIGETPETLGAEKFEYLTQVGRFWLIAMVARVMEPGCKFDYCPVLEGPGGLGKSTLARALASPEFFSDAHFDLTRGKEGQEQVQGIWLYELAELANLGKAEVNLIKAFISMMVDRYRPSYGRTVESFPRQCVMVGTTNEDNYLRDRTGNRRMWPIPVRHRIRLDWLQRHRDLLFAEAYQAYLRGDPYAPTPEDEERLYVPMQESRVVETAVISELQHIFTRSPTATGAGVLVNDLLEFATLAQVTHALGVDAGKSSSVLEGQIRAWFKQEGWVREKKQVNGVRAWGYTRPRNWPKRDYTPDSPPPPATTNSTDPAAPEAAGPATPQGSDSDPF